MGIGEDFMDRVQELIKAGRLRTAMDELLRAVRHPSPDGFLAWLLALGLLANGRTENRIAVEPMTEAQYASALMAKFASECSVCKKFWYTINGFMGSFFTEHRVMNPMGAQCQTCRYTLCRDCLHWTPRSGSSVDTPRIAIDPCPEVMVV